MLPHQIKLIKTGQEFSFWRELKDEGKHCSKVDSIFESGTPHEIAEALLSEFKETPKELLPRFKQMIIDWLSSTNEATYEFENNEKIRDLIYEMF